MITVFCGDNNFAIEQAVKILVQKFNGETERIDGEDITLEQLADLSTGASLFSQQRSAVIRGLSENKTVWSEAIGIFERMDDATNLVLVEPSIDKRTKTYKWLQANADIQTFAAWNDYDIEPAKNWVTHEFQQRGLPISSAVAGVIIERVGTDQWQLHHAIEKLTVFESIDVATVEGIVPVQANENVFSLFETTLKGDHTQTQHLLTALSIKEDPYRVFGLLTSQAMQLLTLSSTEKPARDVARDIGAHPFALQKLAPYAKQLHPSQRRTLIRAFAKADRRLKSSDTDPWSIIEQALLSIA